jgi:hypothetical protein
MAAVAGGPPVGAAPAIPEDLARWLALVYIAPIAQAMTEAELPPSIDRISLTCEGYPVDDDFLPSGLTVDVEIAASNCATVLVTVPGLPDVITLASGDALEPRRTHRFAFPATESGPIVVTASNALGEGLETVPPRPVVRVLQAPAMPAVDFGQPPATALDDEAVQYLAAALRRRTEYLIDVDVPDLAERSLTISAAMRAGLFDWAGLHSRWARRALEATAPHGWRAEVADPELHGRALPNAVRLPGFIEELRVPAVPRVVPVHSSRRGIVR